MGFWVIFPNEPTELSRPEKFMQKDEAKPTKFKEMLKKKNYEYLVRVTDVMTKNFR
jgi:hypothetical protein